MTSLNHYIRSPHSGSSPKQAVVLLHGYGSNGQDLISLAPYFAKAVPDAVFISPDAPFPCEMGGGANENMRQWFSLAEYTPAKLLEGTQMATPILNEYLDEVLAHYNLSDKDLALVGFSQGTMMSLFAGPRRKNIIAGILGYSGALTGAKDLASLNKPPIHLIHGESDPVVTIDRYHHAVENLTKNGFTVTGHTTPHLEHSIDEQGIQSGSAYLSGLFN